MFLRMANDPMVPIPEIDGLPNKILLDLYNRKELHIDQQRSDLPTLVETLLSPPISVLGQSTDQELLNKEETGAFEGRY